ncbi:hypothetical protein [Rheinheimera sp.]|uniref:hypothetical protein n=1 Tax=Rheinheimera sp. TaxID=1869214 RepID=UPI003AF96E2D
MSVPKNSGNAENPVAMSQRKLPGLRFFLLALLMVLGAVNSLLDALQTSRIANLQPGQFLFVAAMGLLTVLPAVIANIVASKHHFKCYGWPVYQLAADAVLATGVFAWGLMLFSDRAIYQDGASHLYVVTWPLLLGVIAVALYLVCLLVQLSCWVGKRRSPPI